MIEKFILSVLPLFVFAGWFSSDYKIENIKIENKPIHIKFCLNQDVEYPLNNLYAVITLYIKNKHKYSIPEYIISPDTGKDKQKCFIVNPFIYLIGQHTPISEQDKIEKDIITITNVCVRLYKHPLFGDKYEQIDIDKKCMK